MEAVPVSRGVGGGSVSIHPAQAVKQIEAAARRALDKDISRIMPDMPDVFNVEINFREHVAAYKAGFYPGVVRHGVHTVSFRAGDWYEVLRTLFFIL